MSPHGTPRVGIEPAARIVVMENHDEAYYVWHDAGAKNRVLVHIDAHHDMWWTGNDAPITIADFICPALKEDLVGELYWIVPDATFESARSRKPVLRHLKEILKQYPASVAPVIEADQIISSVLGKKLTVCPLRSLPALAENVLLDIDVDFMIIPRVAYGEDQHSPLPWRWPSQLVEQLHGISSDLITVAYSVVGGYTPLQWKYLGDELVLRMKQPGTAGPELEGMDRIREGAEAEASGETSKAEAMYLRAMELLPRSAAPGTRLARLLARQGRLQEGQRLYRQALALDSSYGGPYSGAGFHRFRRREFGMAEQEFREILLLDPEEAYAHYGLGLLAEKRKRWDEAERHLRTALAGDDSLVGAHSALGDVLAKQGKKQQAVTAYERSLKLGLMGGRPLSGPILTHAPSQQILDPWHGETHARLAVLYEESGAAMRAITALRFGIAGGFDSVATRLRLARIYARQRHWRESIKEVWNAAKVAPQDARKAWMRWIRRLQRASR